MVSKVCMPQKVFLTLVLKSPRLFKSFAILRMRATVDSRLKNYKIDQFSSIYTFKPNLI